jgi:uncharacterized membrane protein YhdT
VVDLHVRTGEFSRILEFHPVLATLAMLGGLGATIALAWLLPAGAGRAVFALGLVVFMLGWPFLLALHLEDTFGDFTEVKRWLVTACYLAALVLLPLALAVIELFTGWGWSLLSAGDDPLSAAPAAHRLERGPRGRVDRGVNPLQPLPQRAA